MYRPLFGLLLGVALGAAKAAAPADAVPPDVAPLQNQLKDHPAPYLALHGDDPVAWQKWDAATVERAAAENKILFLSVGYFACHWCHVMQRESYRHAAVAALLNEHFISVKIDRELEPALDDRLMAFAQRTTGRGGWPLNVFVTPDGYPIHALLYAPQPQFLRLLERLQNLWQSDRRRVLDAVRKDAVAEHPATPPTLDPVKSHLLLSAAAERIMRRADLLSGGFGEQSKFPSAPQLEFLLDDYAGRPEPELGEFLRTTFDAMHRLGLNDHLQGGFYRYTVDATWAVPHFEKMLYDNAALALLYLRAARVLGEPAYRDVARVTLDFMRDEMLHADGAMVASFSAVDERGVEGGNYLWELDELERVLGADELDMVKFVWGVDRPPDFDAGNHLRFFDDVENYAAKRGLTPDAARARLDGARRKMLAARGRRPLPVDDKLLAGWNGLALRAFAEAAATPGFGVYRATAEKLRTFLLTRLWDGERLTRALVKGEPHGSASLEDYAYVAQGLLAWAGLTGAGEDYAAAAAVAGQGWKRFYRNNGWYREDDTLLAPPSSEALIADGSLPSPAAVLIATTLRLAPKTALAHVGQALSALNRGERVLNDSPYWYVSQLQALKIALAQ